MSKYQRRRIHDMMKQFDELHKDDRSSYSIVNGRKCYDIGVCRHGDVITIIGTWIHDELARQNLNAASHPVHVFRGDLLRYVFVMKDIIRDDTGDIKIICEQTTIAAGKIHECIMEDDPVVFEFKARVNPAE